MITRLAMTAKNVIDAAWLDSPSYDLSTQAAEALESAQLLQAPDTITALRIDALYREADWFHAAHRTGHFNGATVARLLRGRAAELETELLEKFRAAADGSTAPPSPRVVFSPQLRSVLVGLACGESLTDTARRMCLSPHTVKTHRRRLYRQLGVCTGAHAVAIALRDGLIRPDEIVTTGVDAP